MSYSTEDMLNAVAEANRRLKKEKPEEGSISIFSMDASALYPSLDINDINDSLWKLITTSKLKFNNVEMKEVIKYVTILHTEEELRERGVISTIPRRQTEIDGTMRSKPEIAFLDSDYYQNYCKWREG